jgi:hypothetical protein
VGQLKRSIQSWIDTWNQNPRPFVWTRDADEILDTIAAYFHESTAQNVKRGKDAGFASCGRI